MIQTQTPSKLHDYYAHIQEIGGLLTEAHAQRWSRATLNMLGVNIDRKVKKELIKALPEELGRALNAIFWLFYFRDTSISAHEFQNRVARRGGNTDPEFAHYPVMGVFGGLKNLISQELSRKVAESLSPELREMWNKA